MQRTRELCGYGGRAFCGDYHCELVQNGGLKVTLVTGRERPESCQAQTYYRISMVGKFSGLLNSDIRRTTATRRMAFYFRIGYRSDAKLAREFTLVSGRPSFITIRCVSTEFTNADMLRSPDATRALTRSTNETRYNPAR
jgi:hypothetical protein